MFDGFENDSLKSCMERDKCFSLTCEISYYELGSQRITR